MHTFAYGAVALAVLSADPEWQSRRQVLAAVARQEDRVRMVEDLIRAGKERGDDPRFVRTLEEQLPGMRDLLAWLKTRAARPFHWRPVPVRRTDWTAPEGERPNYRPGFNGSGVGDGVGGR